MSWNFEYSSKSRSGLRLALEKRRSSQNFTGAVFDAVVSAINALPENEAAVYSIRSHGHVDAHHGHAMIEVKTIVAED